jgi:hypothetical protein
VVVLLRVIEDLARTVDVPTARLALRRLEYRSQTIRLEGSTFPWQLVPLPLASGLVGLLIAVALTRILRILAEARSPSTCRLLRPQAVEFPHGDLSERSVAVPQRP